MSSAAFNLNKTMNKKEFIEHAWGTGWEFIKDHIDKNGWVDCSLCGDPAHFNLANNMEYKSEGITYCRPSILEGIEDNNGWNKVDTIGDLPTTDAKFFWVLLKDDLKNAKLVSDEAFYEAWEEVAYWQKITAMKHPLY